MSDLREAIREIYLNHARRCHDPEVCIDEPIDTDKWRGCSGHTADAVLDVITAHMAVTDEDALQLLRGYWRNVGASFHDAEIKHVVELLEAFVARRKPDPTPELRDAIKAMEHVRNYAEAESYFPGLSRAQIDAVLAALGEPK